MLHMCQSCLLVPQQIEMDQESIKERRGSQKGPTGQDADAQDKDKSPEKTTVLQKNVSTAP